MTDRTLGRADMTTSAQLGEGSVLSLGEADYCYGSGTLILRVEELGADPSSFRRLEWVRIVGREVLATGDDGARRVVMARVAVLANAILPATPTTVELSLDVVGRGEGQSG
jgi:hypothetical protein